MQVKRVERSAARVKRRLYGEAHCAALSWDAVWSHLDHEVSTLAGLEHTLVAELAPLLSTDARDRLLDRLLSSELTSPSRPHPWSPHLGPFAHVGRLVLARTDRFWDAAEGRIAAS